MKFLEKLSTVGGLISRIIPIAAPILLLHSPAAASPEAFNIFFKVYCTTAVVILLLPLLMEVTLRSSTTKHLKDKKNVTSFLEVVVLLAGGFILIGSVQVFFMNMSTALFYSFLGLMTLTAFNERYVHGRSIKLAISLYFFTIFYQAFLLFILLRVQSFRPGILYCMALAASCSTWPLGRRILANHIATVEEELKEIPEEDPVEIARRKKGRKKKKRREKMVKEKESRPLTRWQKRILRGPALPEDQLMRRLFAILLTLGPLTIGIMACSKILPSAYAVLLIVPVLFSRSLIEPLSLSEDSSPLPEYFQGKTALYLLVFLILLGVASLIQM